MGMFITGVCVGIKDEDIEYTKDGQDKVFRSIAASFIDPSGIGEPIAVDLKEDQLQFFKPVEHYSFPVEAGVMSTKRGNFCRISIPKNGKIQKIGPNNVGTSAPPQPNPAK